MPSTYPDVFIPFDLSTLRMLGVEYNLLRSSKFRTLRLLIFHNALKYVCQNTVKFEWQTSKSENHPHVVLKGGACWICYHVSGFPAQVPFYSTPEIFVIMCLAFLYKSLFTLHQRLFNMCLTFLHKSLFTVHHRHSLSCVWLSCTSHFLLNTTDICYHVSGFPAQVPFLLHTRDICYNVSGFPVQVPFYSTPQTFVIMCLAFLHKSLFTPHQRQSNDVSSHSYFQEVSYSILDKEAGECD